MTTLLQMAVFKTVNFSKKALFVYYKKNSLGLQLIQADVQSDVL